MQHPKQGSSIALANIESSNQSNSRVATEHGAGQVQNEPGLQSEPTPS